MNDILKDVLRIGAEDAAEIERLRAELDRAWRAALEQDGAAAAFEEAAKIAENLYVRNMSGKSIATAIRAKAKGGAG